MIDLSQSVIKLYGDDGAEMFRHYFPQLEYTAYWCIEMLNEKSDILSVIPETLDDVLIEKKHLCELHQVKTRNESQGPWTISEVLKVLCKSYSKVTALKKPCHFFS